MTRLPATAVRWAVATAAVLMLAVAWAMDSPVGASPDEPTHITHAWGVATGQTLPGRETITVDENDVYLTQITLPSELLEYQQLDCYLLNTSQTPSCGLVGERGSMVVVPSYMTRYPPLYYLGAGLVLRVALHLGATGEDAMVAARIASGVTALAMVVAAAAVLRRRFRGPGPGLALLAGLTPVSMSLFSNVNPNGVEIAAAVLCAATVVAVREDVRERGRAGAPLLAGFVLSLAILTLSRPLSVVWAALLLVVVLLPGGIRLRRPRISRELVTFAVAVLVLLAGVAWLLYARQTRTIGDEEDGHRWSDYSLAVQAVLVALKFGGLVQQMIGMVGSDTSLPILLVISWCVVSAVAITALAVGARPASTRLAYAGWFALASVLSVAGYSVLTAFGWQGRYWLPAVAAALVLTVPSLTGPLLDRRPTRRLGVVVAVVLGGLQVGGFLWHLWRYVYGVDGYYYRFDAIPRPLPEVGWLPPIGQPATFWLLLLGTTALIVLVLGPWHPKVGTAVAAEGPPPEDV